MNHGVQVKLLACLYIISGVKRGCNFLIEYLYLLRQATQLFSDIYGNILYTGLYSSKTDILTSGSFCGSDWFILIGRCAKNTGK